MLKYLTEFGLIKLQKDEENDSLNQIFVSEKAFVFLKKKTFEPNADVLFRYSIRYGVEQIQVRNYVGLLETPDGTQIEILPKISDEQTLEISRKALLKMLKSLQNSPFKQLSEANLKETCSPILEIFANQFLHEVETIIRQGLGSNYVEKEENEYFLKGKLLFAENIRQNLQHQERIFIKYDDFLANIPQNRLIKSCLTYLLAKKTFSNKTIQRLQTLLQIFDEIKLSTNFSSDFERIKKSNRLFDRYQKALAWTEIFLLNKSFSPSTGKYQNLALLFPMEKLFENYVAFGFQKYKNENQEISFQDKSKYLITSHLDEPKFSLRPDILLQISEQNFVFDTKWKRLDFSKKNYGIEQADMYQLFAYGKKYEARNLFLIYPKSADFQIPLDVFMYDSDLYLRVLPFDISANLELEIQKILVLIAE